MSEFYTGLLILLFALVVIWFVAAIARRQQAREAAAYEAKRFNEIRA
jgi:preprotein translocase subunit YajC